MDDSNVGSKDEYDMQGNTLQGVGGNDFHLSANSE